MKCQKCGSEIKDGHLYCENCGEEIRIVPDFDATVDENIDIHFTDDIDTDGVIDELSKISTKEISKDIEKEATREIKLDIEKETSKDNYFIKALVFAGAICVVIVVLIIIINSKVSSYYSADIQYEKAFELYEDGEYQDSIKILKRAQTIDSEDSRIKILLADNYYMLEKYDESNAVLYELSEQYMDEPNITEKIIRNYEAKEDYNALNKYLIERNDDELMERYSKYLVSDVEFSKEEGTYDESFMLELSSNEGSTIYYTISDNDKNTDGENLERVLYSEPIEISLGNYTVTAIAVNEYGTKGNEVTKNYIVDSFKPDKPIVSTKSAIYNVPVPIEVLVPDYELCYYTVDGADPTRDDELYKGPIPMYIGEHEYKFAVITSKGASSEVVSVKTTLELIILIDMETAVNAIKNYKAAKGSNDYKYVCEQSTVVNNATYYIINEYTENGGEDKQTGNHYAVDVLTGLSFRAILNESTGEYKLEQLI